MQSPENPSILFIILLISAGPCALDYSKMKTPDGRWSDPSADELVQRHRIHSGLSMRRRQLNLDKPQLSSTLPSVEEFLVAPSIAREHVESLHQNASANMLFGKNHVEVQPVSMKLYLGRLFKRRLALTLVQSSTYCAGYSYTFVSNFLKQKLPWLY